MRSWKIITFNIWLLVIFNLLLSVGSVWSFQRMNPEIQRIYERNITSMEACADMLLALSQTRVDTELFSGALRRAGSNITEPGEKESIAMITAELNQLRQNVPESRFKLIQSINLLAQYNRLAIIRSAHQAQKLRQAWAWGTVFTSLIFLGICFYLSNRMTQELLYPLKELSEVLESRQQGDQYRRCNSETTQGDMQKIQQSINELLDKSK